jgi:hypothetical protein
MTSLKRKRRKFAERMFGASTDEDGLKVLKMAENIKQKMSSQPHKTKTVKLDFFNIYFYL